MKERIKAHLGYCPLFDAGLSLCMSKEKFTVRGHLDVPYITCRNFWHDCPDYKNWWQLRKNLAEQLGKDTTVLWG